MSFDQACQYGRGQGTGARGRWEPDRIDRRYNFSYTFGMKTAISIPDPIFQAAEEAAARLSMSRSQLYTKAVAAFVEIHAPPT